MKANPLFVAAGVLVILGAAVYYTSENPPTDVEGVPTVLVDVKYADVQEIEIRRPSGRPVAFIRGDDDRWDFREEYDFPADDAAVGLMATNLDNLSADRLVEENVSDWRPYGLEDEGNIAVSMTPKEGESVTVIFGNETPTGAGVFARVAGDPRLFTVYNYVKTSFDKTVFELRDKRILQVASETIETVRMTVGRKRFQFESEGPGKWRIAEPSPVRADNFTVGELVRAIHGAEMTDILPDERAVTVSRAFSRPFAQVEIIDGTEHSLKIASLGGEYFATTSDLGGVFVISSAFAESLDRELADLREKKLFDFGFDPIRSIEVRDHDRLVQISKEGEDWILASEDDRVLGSEGVQTVIDALRNLAAVEFVSESAADQQVHGLGTPAIKATVTSGSESAPLSETVIVTDPDSTRVMAARAGEPSSYRVEQAAAQELRRALRALAESKTPDATRP